MTIRTESVIKLRPAQHIINAVVKVYSPTWLSRAYQYVLIFYVLDNLSVVRHVQARDWPGADYTDLVQEGIVEGVPVSVWAELLVVREEARGEDVCIIAAVDLELAYDVQIDCGALTRQ